eukprot:5804829-Amphidinium_carterae.2
MVACFKRSAATSGHSYANADPKLGPKDASVSLCMDGDFGSGGGSTNDGSQLHAGLRTCRVSARALNSGHDSVSTFLQK